MAPPSPVWRKSVYFIAIAILFISYILPTNGQRYRCGRHEFRCNNGKCIPIEFKCNNQYECDTGEDEDNCPCTDEEFQCNDGNCIPIEYQCDQVEQCDDGSDEVDCKATTKGHAYCPIGRFTCGDSSCISILKRCDGKVDCKKDLADEEDCPCSKTEWQCDYGSCIPIDKRCDGNIDCPDDISDERNCFHYYDKCQPEEFLCDDLTCLPQTNVCDGYVDCNDGTDEMGCRNHTVECAEDHFQCEIGLCIRQDDRCNGIRDCVDGTDELKCEHCHIGAFHCHDGECIPEDKRCDGKADCYDLSDESSCRHCNENQFSCNNGLCLDNRLVCDGVNNCQDGSDESHDMCGYEATTQSPGRKVCRRDEWQCDNGECIQREFLCDGSKDCYDWSDENHCQEPTCEDDEFMCQNECFKNYKKCDGFPDCADSSDEHNCDDRQPSITCPEHQCPGEDVCYSESDMCDGHRTCRDGSDEADCATTTALSTTITAAFSGTCKTTDFTCTDGQTCIDAVMRCDNFYDCKDFSDEQNCFGCGSREFRCSDGQCIHDYYKCDGNYNCLDGSDERDCPVKCRSDEWACEDGQCIASHEHCNGVIDCPDRSDERGCPPIPRPRCRSHEFTCNSGECVPSSSACNGIPECGDYSDEDNCNDPACSPNEFRCENDPCIPIELRCNGHYDCPYDTSDELDCPDQPRPTHPPHTTNPPSDGRLHLKTYPSSQIIKERREVVFQCRDEGSVRAKVVWRRADGRPLPPGTLDVNGRLEIPNIKHEHGGDYVCEAVGYPKSAPGNSVAVTLEVEKYNPIIDRPSSACAYNEATCMNGDCIPKHKICDKHHDCIDGSDENGCSKLGSCEPNEYKCNNNKCILKIWRCDGEKDCEDNSDEESCATLPPGSVCRHDEFKCYDGQCVPKSFHCDKQNDCVDNSDEIGCTTPSVITRPPSFVELRPGETFNITCFATGVPVPLIAWRLNWGHIPDKCVTSSVDGYGVLTCHNVEKKDSGAYSCEIINTMGSIIVSPDTILVVTDNTQYCENGLFNSQATSQSDCINCFCFGVSNQCSSANLFTYSLPPPVKSLSVVGVTLPTYSIGDFSAHDLISTQHGIQLRYSNLPVTGQQPFYSLPSDYLGNQLKSYGGSIRYQVEYYGNGELVNSPDIIMTGNKQFLIYKSDQQLVPNERHHVVASFTPGHWHKVDGSIASRQEIMMALANVDHLLIKLQYVKSVQRTVELLHIDMDSAGIRDFGLGSASLVEECRCPIGYTGLSCESCAPGYMRQESGTWLGRCVQIPVIDNCRPGQYGEPSRGIPCKPCPCPREGSGNTCRLDSRGYVLCDCPRGYAGSRCEVCEEGYYGDPMYGTCEPEPEVTGPDSNCDPYGTERTESDGSCVCKPSVTGEYCSECMSRSFHLSHRAQTGCIECFCSGLNTDCKSSNLFRDRVQISFTNRRAEPLSVITDYENPTANVAPNRVNVENSELVLSGFSNNDNEVYYWSLPSRFLGDKVTSYGGDLNYTVRYVAPPGGFMSPNNAPDVVIISANDIVILHYRKEPNSPNAPSSYSVPIWEDQWQTIHGQSVNREHLLMTLADVNSILIKATYTTITEESSISQVSLSIATEQQIGSSERAVDVEHCSCPEGHVGLSCEDCAPGFKRSESGNYLAFCEECECNGHSDECDPETGVCINCEHNTAGKSCESCAYGFSGNATRGTPYDCDDSTHPPQPDRQCENCDRRGGSCDRDYGRCVCKENVVGNNCNQCREGSYNLDASNPDGCTECFCSGATRSCSGSRLYREQMPMIIFEDKFSITNLDTKKEGYGEISYDFANNEVSYRFDNDLPSTQWYWNLPKRFLGNQILSYGGNLTFSQRTESYDSSERGIDIILVGSKMTLSHSRSYYHDGIYTVQLVEDHWINSDTGSVYPVSRADLLSVLANLDSILVRASLMDRTDVAHLSDITLDTAVSHRTDQAALLVEECRCPSGYRGSSCESCEDMHYLDTYDRSVGVHGSCKRCPCSEHSVGCTLTAEDRVKCTCQHGYYGDYCDSRGPSPTPHPPVHQKPNITVTISSPSLQIIEAGHTIRINCIGQYLLNLSPINVKWFKLNGEFSHRVRDDQGTLIIMGSQIDDSGTYQCRAQSGREIVAQNVSIVVEDRNGERPTVSLSSPYIDENEYDPAEVTCTATGHPSPTLTWTRLDGRMPTDIEQDGGYLRFNSLRKSDEGEYQCLGSNSAGTGEQIMTVYVKVASPNVRPEDVYIEPSHYTGRTGDDVTLTCVSSSHRNLIWSKSDSRQLPFNAYVSGNVLIIQNAQTEDSGSYTCTTISNDNRPHSSYVEVIIHNGGSSSETLPVITQLPESHSIAPGNDYNLVCEASGNPHPVIRWSMHLGTFQHNVQQVGNTLRIVNAQPNNRGIYICIAENDVGTDESNTRIDIVQSESPVIELEPREPQTVRLGEPVMIGCRVVSGSPTPTITWGRRDGRPLSRRFKEEYDGTITLEEAQLEDAGEYECRAENSAGIITASTVIIVQYSPIITLRPNVQHLKITEGQDLNINCMAEGSPAPIIVWETPDHITRDSRVHSANLPRDITLQKKRVTLYDSGRYGCRATNEAGSEIQYIVVEVEKLRGDIPSNTDRPAIGHPEPKKLEPYYFLINDTSTLTCDVSGHFRETTWRRSDGRDLPYDARTFDNKLVIERTGHDAAGIYECVIDDGYNPPHAAAIVELVLIDAPRITFSPKMPIRVQSGDNVDIQCNVEGEQPIRVIWHAENEKPFPRSVRIYGNTLHFNRITTFDAGKYYCFASNEHGNVTKLAQVLVYQNEIVNPHPNPRNDRVKEVKVGDTISLDCNYGNQPDIVNVNWYRSNGELPRQSTFDGNRLVLRQVNIEDAGKYVCEIIFQDRHSTEDYVQVNVNRDQRLPFLTLEPSISNLRQGDSLEVECISKEGTGSPIIWETADGGRLPYNFKQIGNRLVMNDVQLQNSGHYVCKCNGHDGGLYTSEYELNIEAVEHKKPTKPTIEYAEVGSNVILRCHTGHYPTRYLWTRPAGPLPSGQDITNNEMSLKNVQAKDAGTYICTASHSGESIDLATILVITGAIPHFPQAPKSYMVLPKLEDAYMRFNFEITFKPERPNGLILYNGQRRGGGDYIALSLNDGYPEFRFDFGLQPTILRAEKPVKMGQWHTVKINRVRKDGFMIVDDQPAVEIPSTTRFQGLELIENMYLGGVPKFEDIAITSTEYKEGFVGCISRLVLRERVVELNEESIYVEGTTSCEPCGDDPCSNGGVCLEAQTENGYACVCMDGFTGKTCAVEGYGCLANTCGSGRCIELEVGVQCLCPLNKTGDRCQYIEHLDEENLSFKDGSFAAYKTPKATKMNIKFRIRPENLNDSVVLYIAESDTSNGDFAAVVIKDKHVEFRFVTGAKLEPAIIRSRYPIEANKWTEIMISRRHGEGALQVGNEPQITGKLVGPARSMYLKTHLYVGGYDKQNHLNTGVGITRGFDGCISGLEASNLPINMIADILDGVNVQNCGQSKVDDSHINDVNNICLPGFSGKSCEIIVDVCSAQNPCENGGICKSKGLDFNCDCPLGFTGDVCQHAIKIEIAGHFRGDGYIELDRDAISNDTTQGTTGVAVLFSTSHSDGLLVWYGQNKGEYYKGQDFISLAVVNGFLEFSFRLNGEESIINNPTTRVDDGFRHVAIIKREGNQASFELDYFTMHGQCRPTDKKEAFIPGHLFIGGAPDLGNFTGNRYTNGFSGCVHIVEPLNGGSINFTQKAVSALNVDNCPLTDDEIDTDTEPPVV